MIRSAHMLRYSICHEICVVYAVVIAVGVAYVKKNVGTCTCRYVASYAETTWNRLISVGRTALI